MIGKKRLPRILKRKKSSLITPKVQSDSKELLEELVKKHRNKHQTITPEPHFTLVIELSEHSIDYLDPTNAVKGAIVSRRI